MKNKDKLIWRSMAQWTQIFSDANVKILKMAFLWQIKMWKNWLWVIVFWNENSHTLRATHLKHNKHVQKKDGYAGYNQAQFAISFSCTVYIFCTEFVEKTTICQKCVKWCNTPCIATFYNDWLIWPSVTCDCVMWYCFYSLLCSSMSKWTFKRKPPSFIWDSESAASSLFNVKPYKNIKSELTVMVIFAKHLFHSCLKKMQYSFI